MACRFVLRGQQSSSRSLELLRSASALYVLTAKSPGQLLGWRNSPGGERGRGRTRSWQLAAGGSQCTGAERQARWRVPSAEARHWPQALPGRGSPLGLAPQVSEASPEAFGSWACAERRKLSGVSGASRSLCGEQGGASPLASSPEA